MKHMKWLAAMLVAVSTAAVAADMAEAEVRKVDKQAKKITLKHGPIRNLDMPPMTMVFQVRDPALLDNVKQGDKVKITWTDNHNDTRSDEVVVA